MSIFIAVFLILLFLVLDEKEVSIPYFSCIFKWCHIKAIRRNLKKCRKYAFLGGGPSQFITILHGGEGSLGTPNLYYVINGRPLRKNIKFRKLLPDTCFLGTAWRLMIFWSVKLNDPLQCIGIDAIDKYLNTSAGEP